MRTGRVLRSVAKVLVRVFISIHPWGAIEFAGKAAGRMEISDLRKRIPTAGSFYATARVRG